MCHVHVDYVVAAPHIGEEDRLDQVATPQPPNGPDRPSHLYAEVHNPAHPTGPIPEMSPPASPVTAPDPEPVGPPKEPNSAE